MARVAKIKETEPSSIFVWKLGHRDILPPLGSHKSLHWRAPHLDLSKGGLIVRTMEVGPPVPSNKSSSCRVELGHLSPYCPSFHTGERNFDCPWVWRSLERFEIALEYLRMFLKEFANKVHPSEDPNSFQVHC